MLTTAQTGKYDCVGLLSPDVIEMTENTTERAVCEPMVFEESPKKQFGFDDTARASMCANASLVT